LRAANERDHTTEQLSADVAAVCDRGRVHTRNEDAFALASSDGRVVLVVCDGVTSATDSDIASLAAARAARDLLAAAPPASSTAPSAVVERWTHHLTEATAAAQHASSVSDHVVAPGENPASTTFVAAV